MKYSTAAITYGSSGIHVCLEMDCAWNISSTMPTMPRTLVSLIMVTNSLHMAGRISVSYTHLDVYKRQAQFGWRSASAFVTCASCCLFLPKNGPPEAVSSIFCKVRAEYSS